MCSEGDGGSEICLVWGFVVGALGVGASWSVMRKGKEGKVRAWVGSCDGVGEGYREDEGEGEAGFGDCILVYERPRYRWSSSYSKRLRKPSDDGACWQDLDAHCKIMFYARSHRGHELEKCQPC